MKNLVFSYFSAFGLVFDSVKADFQDKPVLFSLAIMFYLIIFCILSCLLVYTYKIVKKKY